MTKNFNRSLKKLAKRQQMQGNAQISQKRPEQAKRQVKIQPQKNQSVQIKKQDEKHKKQKFERKQKKIIKENKNQKPKREVVQDHKEKKKIVQNDKQNDRENDQEKRIKHNRLIIRNLVFDISEKHLRKLFAPFGNIIEINIPKMADGKGTRGFAFIQFQNRNHCLKAIKQLNGTSYKGRNIILDQSVSKQRFMQSKVNEQITQHKQEQKNQQMEQENKNIIKVQAKQEEIEEEVNTQKEIIKKESEVKKQREPQNLESTIFIRNLPINVTQEELHKFFRKYGKLKFAKVVKNQQTGTSKGSAFVKFVDAQKAKQLVQYSKSYEMSMLGKSHDFKMNPAINLQLEGTILNLFPVQKKDQINQKIKNRDNLHKDPSSDEKKKKPIKKIRHLDQLVGHDTQNKRKLNLALLGMWKASDQMKQNDFQKFKNHEKQKVEKLKNPNNSVSDTRIILKFLKKDITQDRIRQLCQQYLKENGHKFTTLTYCKLMMTDNMTKSAGFAFVQFKTHEISLGFLEWICAQPKRVMIYPFVCQFAIQDSRKLMKLHNKSKKPSSTLTATK